MLRSLPHCSCVVSLAVQLDSWGPAPSATIGDSLVDGDDWEGGGGGGGGFGPSSPGGARSEQRKAVPIGTVIKREFPGFGVYDGTVVEYKKPYYRVVYADGDSEQLLGRELRPLIAASHL